MHRQGRLHLVTFYSGAAKTRARVFILLSVFIIELSVNFTAKNPLGTTVSAGDRESGQSSGAVRLVVSIVAWRGAELTIDCLRSVEPEVLSLGNCHVFVVDNDSQDGAAERVSRAILEYGWSSWVTFIQAPSNRGFASGNNIAIRAALATYPAAEYFLLLNPDTIVRPEAFRILRDFMVEHPDVGIAGGRSENLDASPQHCCFRFPNPASELCAYLRTGVFDRLFNRFLTRIGIPEQPCQVDWVSGAHMMIRKAVIGDIGLLDEGYFLYYEETDFTLRAKRAGWGCWHVPASRIVHLVGQSSGVTVRDQRPKRRPAYWFEARRRYFVLNHGRLYTAFADVLVMAGYLFWRARRLLQRSPNTDPPYFLRDFIRHSAIFNGRTSLKPRQTGL